MSQLTPKAERELGDRFTAQHDALRIFSLVVAEWKSDPMSVQCFDLRIVEEAKLIDAKLKKLDPFYP